MRCTSLLVVAAAAIAAHHAPADEIMSNLELADDDGGTLYGPGSNTEFKAYGWTMPSDAYFLDAVTLRMFDYNMPEARVSIWDGESVPENELVVLDNPREPGVEDWFDIAFTPPEQFTLEADTTYWVYVEPMDGAGNGFLWGDTTDQTPPSGIGENVGYIFNGNPSSFMNAIRIEGTLVPAPAAAALLGLAGVATRRRRA